MNLVNCEKAALDIRVHENLRMNTLSEKVTRAQAQNTETPETFMAITPLGSGVHFCYAYNSRTLSAFYGQSCAVQLRSSKQYVKYGIKFKSTASWWRKQLSIALYLSLTGAAPVHSSCTTAAASQLSSSLRAGSLDPLGFLARQMFMNDAFSVKIQSLGQKKGMHSSWSACSFFSSSLLLPGELIIQLTGI